MSIVDIEEGAPAQDPLEEAAAIVRRHLAEASVFADYYIARAWTTGPAGKKVDYSYLVHMNEMVRLCADLASTLVRLKGEVRQRIVVEHVEVHAPPALIGETRTLDMTASAGGRGEGADSAKQLDAVPRHVEPTS